MAGQHFRICQAAMAEGRPCICSEEPPGGVARHAKPRQPRVRSFAGRERNRHRDRGKEERSDRSSLLPEPSPEQAADPEPVRPRHLRRWPSVVTLVALVLLTSAAVPVFDAVISGNSKETSEFEEIDRTPDLPPVLPPPDPPLDEPGADEPGGGETEAQVIEAPDPTESKPKPTRKPSAAESKAPVTYQSWNGRGCRTPDDGGYDEIGQYWDGTEGWYVRLHGGHEGDGCDGSFTAVPMSGSATQDGGARVLWWWSVGSKSKRCSIAVYVPTGLDNDDVAGNPTHYQVLSDPYDDSSRYGSFQVNQVINRGRLVDVGVFDVKGGVLAVKMLDRGEDWSYRDRRRHRNRSGDRPHHAAAQIKLTCRS